MPCLEGSGEVVEAELGAAFDDLEGLAEAVVKFACDAFAFGFLGFDEAAGEEFLGGAGFFVLVDAKFVCAEDGAGETGEGGKAKPPGLPPWGNDDDCDGRAGRVPLAILVHGVDAELIFACGQTGVGCLAGDAGTDPCTIVTFEAIAKSSFFRGAEAEGGVAKAEASDAGRDGDGVRSNGQGAIVGGDFFDVDGGGLAGGFDCLWVDDDESAGSAKPKGAGAGFHAGGLKAAAAG